MNKQETVNKIFECVKHGLSWEEYLEVMVSYNINLGDFTEDQKVFIINAYKDDIFRCETKRLLKIAIGVLCIVGLLIFLFTRG